jgi:cytochrome c-type biogenesis protein CcmE
MRGRLNGRLLLVGTLAVSATIAALVFGLSKPKVMYSRGVFELLQNPLRDRPLRVEGILVGGSLCKVEKKCEFQFRMTDKPGRAPPGSRDELEVRFANCVVPDTFADVPGVDVEVVAEGELCEDCSYFAATQILAKCASKYEIPGGDAGVLRRLPVPPCGRESKR